MGNVVGLDELGRGDLDVAGGKGANLGELLRAGLPVPGGFVVTTDAYAQAAEAVGLAERVADAEPEELRRMLQQAPITDALRAQVHEAYATLGGEVAVAVRSSATAEDLPGAAFAGQQDTYLNIVGVDAVIDAIRNCWASLWTDRAVSYRRERRVDPHTVRIAVVVQVLVDADLAGVMFSADPVTGARDRIVVDAAAGLGEAVVSGMVTPDHYLLSADGEQLEFTAGRADIAIRSIEGGGVREVAAPASDSPLLNATQLRGLAGYARAAERHFGRPQDMEWAIADGEILILQARPMTALPPEAVPMNRRQRLQSVIFSEYLPVRPYPMDMTTWTAKGPADMMRQITEYFGLRGAFAGYLREEDGVVVQFVPPNPHPGPGILLAPFKVIGKVAQFHVEGWTRDPRLARLLAGADALDSLDLAGLSWRELQRVPVRALDLMDISRDLRIDYLPGAGAAIARMAIVATLLGRKGMLGDLTGGAPTRTAASERALVALAETVRSDAPLRALFEARTPDEIVAELEKGDFADFTAALDAFRHDFGRKETTSPLLVSPPTLAESPAVIIGMIATFVEHPPQEDPSSKSQAALQKFLRHPLLRPHWAQRLITRWMRAAQAGVGFREDTHFYFTASLPALRRALLEIGARLRDAGVLDEPFDVFHLRWEEVTAIREIERIAPADVDRLRGLVTARAAKRAELAGIPLVDLRQVFRREKVADALVGGAPAGGGTAEGPVRVIREAADFHRLQQGDVLVCPYTNPAWTPLFLRAVAVVVDTGSIASHAAIVAREYGLPAVMGAGDGTSTLVDGDRVRVDGTTGRVTRA
ncbi:PEP/pyruvate-binding domain-containing protein [Microbacterium sp. H1-D42]|uniref:PEP/pyruvate-binding domain-containing protein n=1 Tax=Microbacterium sp. H1-D42 TaxID=2925844 RepID=UPI001F5388B5|nr:PEP/pyruvate-binding domain-containing protein [Microbacterium sp. H1-D42]UNK70881.1 PEP-utilizing enzyme [Microbacterium sp. H1-D42]